MFVRYWGKEVRIVLLYVVKKVIGSFLVFIKVDGMDNSFDSINLFFCCGGFYRR